MSIQVSITKGHYRGEEVSGVFTLIRPYKEGAKGGFVTIRNPNFKPGTGPIQRITVEKHAFTLLDADGTELGDHVVVDGGSTPGTISITTNYEQVFVAAETEDEAMERISYTFMMLDRIVDGCTKPGDTRIRGLIVSGPPGIGKSFGVEKQLEAANMFRTLAGKDPRYEIVSGGVSSIGLYQKLYHNRHSDQVLVFDDCDGVLLEEECLTLMKAALNSGDRRKISWNKESRVLQSEDIPDSFDFEASVIFLTNVDFERTIERSAERATRLAEHLSAIMSRCHYLDLEMGSTRDKLLRIKQVVRDGMLSSYLFTTEEEHKVLEFVFTNAEYLRELSLRMVKKIADFVKTTPDCWEEMAEATCLKREAKFKRLVEQRRAEAARRGLVLAETV